MAAAAAAATNNPGKALRDILTFLSFPFSGVLPPRIGLGPLGTLFPSLRTREELITTTTRFFYVGIELL